MHLSAGLQCRIGDLAFIIRPEVASNYGVLVEVVEDWPAEPASWWVRSLCGPRLRIDGKRNLFGAVADIALRPIGDRGVRPSRSLIWAT